MNKELTSLLDNRVAIAMDKSYKAAFREWQAERIRLGRPVVPAELLEVANFLAVKARKSGSVGAVHTMAAAISHHHTKNFFASPTEHKSVRLLLESVKKNYSKPVVRRRPFTDDILHRVKDEVDRVGSLWRWRTLWRMYMGYYGFLRWDETSNLRIIDISFSSEHMSVHIRRSKCDQAGAGHEVRVQRQQETKYCPVTITESYRQRLRYAADNTESFFQPRLRRTVNGESGIPNTQLGYSNALADLKKLLTEAGIDPALYGEHSGRRGGATAAAAAGVSWLELKRHGRWKSDSAPQAYIDTEEGNHHRAAVALSQEAPKTSSTQRDPPHLERATRYSKGKKGKSGWNPWQ